MMDVRDFIAKVLNNATDLSDKIYIDLETDEEGFDTAEFEINASNGYLQITVKGVDGQVLIGKREHERLLNRIDELEEELEEAE